MRNWRVWQFNLAPGLRCSGIKSERTNSLPAHTGSPPPTRPHPTHTHHQPPRNKHKPSLHNNQEDVWGGFTPAGNLNTTVRNTESCKCVFLKYNFFSKKTHHRASGSPLASQFFFFWFFLGMHLRDEILYYLSDTLRLKRNMIFIFLCLEQA